MALMGCQTSTEPSAAQERLEDLRALAVALPQQRGALGSAGVMGVDMVWIPPGTFMMGCPMAVARGCVGGGGPETWVTLTKGYWIGRHEVTQGEYQSVMGENPSWFNGVREGLDYGSNPDRPVECVSWKEAVRYCQQLTEEARTSGKLPDGWEFRLPTEAQWEYACRAGTTRCSMEDIDKRSWYYGNDLLRWGHCTQPVRQKLPNAWGLHDMDGNVDEWCEDRFDYFLRGGRVSDPTGLTRISDRVYRGGSYYGHGFPSLRHYGSPSSADIYLGFRVAMVPVP